MSLQQVNETADDLAKRAEDLQREFDGLFGQCPAGEIRDALHVLKLGMCGLRQEARKLHQLTAAARMVGDLPQARVPGVTCPKGAESEGRRAETLTPPRTSPPPPLPEAERGAEEPVATPDAGLLRSLWRAGDHTLDEGDGV